MVFIFPAWVWFLGFLSWFSAEIVTVSTPLAKLDGGTIIFSFSYYLVQMAVVADLILRKRFSLWGVFFLGLIFGLLEEAFYIKNPLFLTLLLALGHAAVTVFFPYLLVNFLLPGEKSPFLSKLGYFLALSYLVILYFLMAQILPFVHPDSFLFGLILLLFLFFLLGKFGQIGGEVGRGEGLLKLEKAAVFLTGVLLVALSQNPYLAVTVVLSWLLWRQSKANFGDLYFFVVLFLLFHFLAAVFNKGVTLEKMAVNYPLTLPVGLIFLFWLLLGKKEKVFGV